MDPIRLVSQQGDGLALDAEGLQQLTALGTTPVAVLTVAGMYRTGKSFLLNQLVDAPGFRVGSTTESCTRGIWLWVAAPGIWNPPPEHPDAKLLVLDTEGLASIDQDETYDAKIFSLSILLSSFFIYNSMGAIDESAVDRLFMVGELTKNICLSTDTSTVGGDGATDEAQLSQFLPPFLWLLRDFHLDLEKDGEAISVGQYLEQALEDRPGSSNRVKENNRIRQSFKALFPDRQCATLVRPASEESDLKILSTLPSSALRPQFTDAMAEIRRTALGRVAPKRLFGSVMSAQMFATMAQSYISAINDGAVPDIKKSWDYVVEETLRTAFEAAQALIAPALRQWALGSSTLPSREALDAKHAELLLAARHAFRQGAGSAFDSATASEWREKLEAVASTELAGALDALGAASQAQCAELAQEVLKQHVLSPLDQGKFDPHAEGATDTDDPEGLLAAAGAAAIAAYEARASGPKQAEVLCAALARHSWASARQLSTRVRQHHEAILALAHAESAEAQQKLAAAEGLLQARAEMLDGLKADKAGLEAELRSTRARAEAAEASGQALQGELHAGEVEHVKLGQQLAETERSAATAAAAAAGQLAELRQALDTLREESGRRETILDGKLLEAEARLEDTRAEGLAMAEQLGELRNALAVANKEQEATLTMHEATIVEHNAVLAQLKRRFADEASAAAGEAAASLRRERLRRQQEASAGEVATVVSELLGRVECVCALQECKKLAVQVRRVEEERNAVKAQLEDLLEKVTNLPGPFQSQMMQGTPDWLQKVINGEAVEGTPEGSGKDGEEECTVQ